MRSWPMAVPQRRLGRALREAQPEEAMGRFLRELLSRLIRSMESAASGERASQSCNCHRVMAAFMALTATSSLSTIAVCCSPPIAQSRAAPFPRIHAGMTVRGQEHLYGVALARIQGLSRRLRDGGRPTLRLGGIVGVTLTLLLVASIAHSDIIL